MVIAKNEWLNNYEDEQKSASATATTTTSISNNSVSNSVQNSSVQSRVTTNTISTSLHSTITSTSAAAATTPATTTPATTPPATTTPATTTETFEEISREINRNIIEPSNQFYREQNLQQLPDVSMVNTKRLMMDDSLKNDRDTNEIQNNNNNIDLANTAFINNSPSAPILLSNTITVQPHTNNVIGPIYNATPITPQALSNALQSAMSSASNNTSVGINLPNNLMCSLANVGISPNATLQHTANLAKQLNSSLTTNDSQTCATNNERSDSNGKADNNLRGDHQHNQQQQQQQINDNNGQAKIVLQCEPNSHPFQTRTILLTPNIECKVGRLIAKSKATESNAIFDCKVLSRNHAVLWYTNDGRFWVKDTKSSNGTFINENKLGTDAAELHYGDVVKFGVDVMENSRKEVHGCIIAGVKLYLPDGRETISIELNTNYMSGYSGASRINFDELHRLNLYMQEASQREKLLKSKLFNIQNILDATRKNSALCWQSMIAEDQLLHRIHALEKKLQIMEKNAPESALRNEVLKLLDDKSSYQQSAKEALRKVYQERCDAMQMLSKMESAFIASDDECKILREQIMNTKQNLQDVNARLIDLEDEYKDFREENKRKRREAIEESDQREAELIEKLQQRDFDCEELKRKISELLLKRADELLEETNAVHHDGNNDNGGDDEADDDERKLEKQAIEKLDAAIADIMDLEDDDDADKEEDINEDAKDGNNDKRKNDKVNLNINSSMAKKGKESIYAITDGDGNKFGGDTNEAENIDSKSSPKTCVLLKDATLNQKLVKKSTILKWLENSDLNEKEGSIDIINAICNESDSSSEDSGEEEEGAGTNRKLKNDKELETLSNDDNYHKRSNQEEEEESLTVKCKNFNEKLRNVQENLSKLEEEIANETKNVENETIEIFAEGKQNDEDNSKENHINEADDGNNLENEAIQEALESPIKSNSSSTKLNVLSSNRRSYLLLKSSVAILREAYNDIYDNMKHQHHNQWQERSKQRLKKQKPRDGVSRNLENYTQHKISKSAGKKLASQLKELQSADAEGIERDLESEARVSKIFEMNEYGPGEEEVVDVEQQDDDMLDETTARLSTTSLQTIKENAHEDEEQKEQEEVEGQDGQGEASKSVKNSFMVTASIAMDEESSSNRKYQQQQQENFQTIIETYQNEIKMLNARLDRTETDAQNTLELMQIECDKFQEKAMELSRMVEALKEEKQALQEVIAQNKSNVEKTEAVRSQEATRLPSNESTEIISDKLTVLSTATKEDCAEAEAASSEGVVSAASASAQIQQIPSTNAGGEIDQEHQQLFEQQLKEEFVNEVEVEEELIMYKERLEQLQCDNLRLRNEISEMVLATDVHTLNLLKRLLPYGVVVVAILIYFIFIYL